MTIDILFVCTANICRSPVAERLASARSTAPSEVVRFSSAGTHARGGFSIDPPSALALVQLGGDPVGHRSRMLTKEMLEQATLVLTATMEHRDFAMRRRPSGLRKTFALKEFVRLGQAVAPASGPDDIKYVISAVADQRGAVPPALPGGDDVDDPFGNDDSDAIRAASEIADSIDAMLGLLGLAAQR